MTSRDELAAALLETRKSRKRLDNNVDAALDVADVVLAYLPDQAKAQAVLEAAEAWVYRIQDRPGRWADDEDLALIEAVRVFTDTPPEGFRWERS